MQATYYIVHSHTTRYPQAKSLSKLVSAQYTLSLSPIFSKITKMKLTAFLLVAPTLLAAAFPTATLNDALSELERREASPIAEPDPLYYIKRAGYTDKR